MRDAYIVGGASVVAIGIGVLFFLFGGSSIASTSPSAVNEFHQTATAVPFMELVHGSKSSVSARKDYLITSADEFSKLWKMVDATGEMPNVDFTKNYVAAVFAGSQSTTGYAVTVSKVEDTTVRMVTVTLMKPGENCSKKNSVTAPYILVQLPQTSLTFTHEDQVTTADCSQ